MEVTKLNFNDLNKIHNLHKEQLGDQAWSKVQLLDAFFNNAISFYGIFEGFDLACFACILTTLDDINLLDIATNEKYKRKGYASFMIQFLLSLKSSEQTFSLEVKTKNTTAIRLYEKLGFKTLHVRKKYYKDGDDALCMFLQEHTKCK